MIRRRRLTLQLRLAPAGPVLALILAACGGGSGASAGVVIDHNVVQNAIEVGVAQQQHVISVVTCPVGVKARKGQKFNCTITFASGRQAPVTVTALDDRGDVHYAGLRGYVNGHQRAANKP